VAVPDRDDPGRGLWLKAIGHARGPLPEAWLADERAPVRLARTGFPRRPRMIPGDRLILYASVWKRVFGIAEVTSEPTDATPPAVAGLPCTRSARWPWWVAIEPLVVIPHLENAPPVEAIGVLPRSMSQQSHIRLSAEHYARAVDVIASIAH
jgi:hypothetical protein